MLSAWKDLISALARIGRSAEIALSSDGASGRNPPEDTPFGRLILTCAVELAIKKGGMVV